MCEASDFDTMGIRILLHRLTFGPREYGATPPSFLFENNGAGLSRMSPPKELRTGLGRNDYGCILADFDNDGDAAPGCCRRVDAAVQPIFYNEAGDYLNEPDKAELSSTGGWLVLNEAG